MRDVEVLSQSARRPPDFNLGKYWERSASEFREKLPQYRAGFRASKDAMAWVRFRGWRLEEERPEGDRIRIRVRFDVEEEAVQFALSFGGDVEAIEPPDLRGKVRERASRAARLHRDPGPHDPLKSP